MNFCNNLFKTSSKNSSDFLEIQKINILLESDKKIKELEDDKILKTISNINEQIKIKYGNIINKYNEIIVQPFNTFTSDYKKFYSNFKTEFSNISDNLISLKNKTNQALHNYKESNRQLQKIKNEGNKMESSEKKRLINDNKSNEEL